MKTFQKGKLLLYLTCFLLFASCGNKNDGPVDLTLDEVKAVWEKIEKMWETQDVAMVAETYAESFTRTSPSGVSTNAEEFDKMELSAYRSAFPDLALELGNITISGNIAVVEWTSSGTFSGPFGPLEPNNARFEKTGGISVLTIENGKVTKDVTYINQLVAWMQMGYMLAPVPAEEPSAVAEGEATE